MKVGSGTLASQVPNARYEGVDAFEFSVRVGTRDSSSFDATPGTVGVHVRDCRRRTYDKRVARTRPVSPLCSCAANATAYFGDGAACPAAVAAVCASATASPSFAALCDACAAGAAVETTRCRRAVDRAATHVAGAGLCDDVEPADCRGEASTRDAPEPYVWWPHRHLVTPDRLALAPLGSRAGNLGDGLRLPATL